MRRLSACVVLGFAATVLVAAPAPAFAGGAQAPSGQTGGAEYGTPLGEAPARRPVVASLRVSPATVTEGSAPSIALRIEQRGVTRVRARIVVWPQDGRGTVVRIDLGRVRTGRVLRPRWPAGQQLAAGRYTVRVHATGPGGATLRRPKGHRGRATLVVNPKPKPKTTSTAVAPPTSGGIFPVAGPHSYGGDDARFGAGRRGHIHQGQDVMAAEGTPVVAPVAGTIAHTDYQSGGAGYYVVQAADDGRHFFYAHCQKGSFAVDEGQRVAAGQQLCGVGSTGSSSGPHLHFEIWIGGWRATKDSHPIDPLPQLLAWDPSA